MTLSESLYLQSSMATVWIIYILILGVKLLHPETKMND